MADASGITADMQVLGSDGGLVGMVDGIEDDRIKLKREPGGGGHHFVPLSWVSRVDLQVHLDRAAARVHDGWLAEAAALNSQDSPRLETGNRRRPWIVWVIGIVFLLIVLYLGILGLQYASGDRTDTRATYRKL